MFSDESEFRRRAPRQREMVIFSAKPADDGEDAEDYRRLLLDIARELDPDASVTWHVIESRSEAPPGLGTNERPVVE